MSIRKSGILLDYNEAMASPPSPPLTTPPLQRTPTSLAASAITKKYRQIRARYSPLSSQARRCLLNKLVGAECMLL